jgi:hypothetical protein
MRQLRRSRPALVLAVAFAAACSDSTAPTPVQVAGVYSLESVSGRGPVAGSFTLTADGRAERRVRYATDPTEIVFIGSFTVDGTTIAFNLVPGNMPAAFVWPVAGQWLGSQFTIKYPDPADGPDIIETYRRP